MLGAVCLCTVISHPGPAPRQVGSAHTVSKGLDKFAELQGKRGRATPKPVTVIGDCESVCRSPSRIPPI